MRYLLIVGAFVVLGFTAPPPVTFATLLCFGLIVAIAQKTLEAVTGAASSADDVFSAVGYAFLFIVVCATVTTSYGYHFSRTDPALAGAASLISYVLGFKVGMQIGLWQATVVALVVTVCTVGLALGVKTII